jgi:hypothetical protein
MGTKQTHKQGNGNQKDKLQKTEVSGVLQALPIQPQLLTKDCVLTVPCKWQD